MFPEKKYNSSENFVSDYFLELQRASTSVDQKEFSKAAELLINTYSRRKRLFVCGNGGSAAISNHLVCDHGKLVSEGTVLLPRVTSLSNNIEVITAIANDISYDEVFEFQLRLEAAAEDVLITISSSGDSENIIRACQWAKDNGLKLIALTGFTGGRSRRIADIRLHVDADNYGIVEDVHQALMHALAQYVKQKHLVNQSIDEGRF